MSEGTSSASGAGTSASTETGAGTGEGIGEGTEQPYPAQPDGYDGYEPDDVDQDDELDDEDELEEDEEEEEEEESDGDDVEDVEDVVDEVVRGLLDRVDRAEELTRADVRDLAWLLGPRPAGRLARTLNGEAAQRRRALPRRGFLATLFAKPHEAPDPVPDSIAALLLRMESGQRVGWADLRRLVRVIGEPATVILQQAIAQAATSGQRRSRRPARRGGRRVR